MAWSCAIRPPTSVYFSCVSTASISATFGHGAPQPPPGLGTSMVVRSAMEVLQRMIERVKAGPPFTYVEGLSQIHCREQDAPP